MGKMVVEESYMEMDFIRNRITELRVKKGVSEYQLSYDLGHSKNYIHNIVRREASRNPLDKNSSLAHSSTLS